MKNFISILVFILSIQLSAKAENISDFQIENMSIGDSLLEFMSENEINQNILDYFPNQRKYYVVAKINDLKTYEQLEIYLKTDDKQYIIKTLGGFISFSDKKCLVTKKKIDEEFSDIFSNLKSYSAKINHAYDKSGKSKQIQTNYVFGDSAHKNDHIRTECISWSEEIKQKEGFKDSLIVIAMTSEILEWIDNNYD
tara:strand:+ start:569 stop:1156 length:588 start_codon:yes stop_codon:yes gene_type:complete